MYIEYRVVKNTAQANRFATLEDAMAWEKVMGDQRLSNDDNSFYTTSDSEGWYITVFVKNIWIGYMYSAGLPDIG